MALVRLVVGRIPAPSKPFLRGPGILKFGKKEWSVKIAFNRLDKQYLGAKSSNEVF